MKTAGIVAEYNPFHTGHAYQIAQTRAQLGEDTAIVCAMSGNWVQGARPAIVDKWLRARLALMGGADLVLELPTPWAVSSAESFAWGAVSLLHAAGVVDTLSFGSECGEVEPLQKLAVCLNSDLYHAGLKRFLDEGMPFAACRQAVAEALLDKETAALLATPNNNLGVEYLRALDRLGSSITPMTIRREGAGYHQISDEAESPAFRSATDLRRSILAENWADVEGYLIPGASELLRAAPRPTADMERALLAKLRTMTAADWSALPDSGAGEGLPERLVRAGLQARSVEEFYELAKTKRYTHARLRRLLLWAFLGLTEAVRPERPPYLKVLGCTERGRVLLKGMKDQATLPVITKPAHVNRLDEDSRRLFELEARCTELYGLFLPQLPPCGREWSQSPILL